MRIFVSNMNFFATEQDIKKLFIEFGPVDNVELCFRPDGRRRGFVFVEMLENENGMKAVIGLDGKEFMGRKLTVQKAVSREEYLRQKEDKSKDESEDRRQGPFFGDEQDVHQGEEDSGKGPED